MNVSVHIVLGNCFRDAFCSPNVDIVKVEVSSRSQYLSSLAKTSRASLRRIISANQVVHNVRVSNAFLDRVLVS